MRIAEGYSKFTLEFLLKFLYQSYSLGSFEKLVRDHKINQKELIDYFSSRLDIPITRVDGSSISVEGEALDIALEALEEDPEEPEQVVTTERVKSLTDFIHQMREDALKEDEDRKKKKKRK